MTRTAASTAKDFPLHSLPTRLLVGLTLLALAVVMGAQAAIASDDHAGQSIFTRNGIAIGGTDPVAYFSEGKPVQGSPEFSAEYMGATWHFANAEHRDRFTADPEAYAPQYGGFCAFGVAAAERKIETVPEAWSIVDGKLYLNYTLPTQERWNEDIPGYIATADQVWPTIK